MTLLTNVDKRARIISGHASLSEAQAFMDEVDSLRGALERFVREARSFHDSTGHEVEGASMHGSCDGICEAMRAAERVLAAAYPSERTPSE